MTAMLLQDDTTSEASEPVSTEQLPSCMARVLD